MRHVNRVALFALSLSFLCAGCSPFAGECERVDREASRSSSGITATVFEVHCGATASNATCVCVRARGWFKKEQTVFVATTLVAVKIEWIAEGVLEVRHDAERIETKREEIDGVTIRYGSLKADADERQPNQALQTTSVTRSGFGKVPVSDRHRRGV
jgi:hypothetical protein